LFPSLRGIICVLLFAWAAPLGLSQDKPTHTNDARRAALLKAGYTAVPLAYYPKSLQFFTDGTIETEKVKFLLDSGARLTAIDAKLAKAAKLELGAETSTPAIGGVSSTRPTAYGKMNIGPVDIGKDWAWLDGEVVDLSHWHGSPQGVLGIEILGTRGAVIDYPTRTLYLRPPLVSAWTKYSGTWDVTSWQEDGATRKLDPKALPTFKFADQRLKITDGAQTREFDMFLWPNYECDSVLFYSYGRKNPQPPAAGGLTSFKNGTMTACMILNPDKKNEGFPIPTEFAAPKGSGRVMLELKRTAPADEKPADPLRELLTKQGYTAVPMESMPGGGRVVAARTGKHDLRLVVDTGASMTTFDSAGLKKWGVEPGERIEGKGWGGKFSGEISVLRSLSVGEYDTRRAWGGTECVATDITNINTFFQQHKLKPVDGFLGNLTLQNGSAVIDFHTNTLYLRPLKETLWPKLEGKWTGVAQEMDGQRAKYADAVAPTVEFKDGRYTYSAFGESIQWGLHIQEYGPHYRAGLFNPKADGPTQKSGYDSGFIFKLTEGKLTIVRIIDSTKAKEEPFEFAAPKGSGLVLMEFERSK
jgi:predicted aspartyl protease